MASPTATIAKMDTAARSAIFRLLHFRVGAIIVFFAGLFQNNVCFNTKQYYIYIILKYNMINKLYAS